MNKCYICRKETPDTPIGNTIDPSIVVTTCATCRQTIINKICGKDFSICLWIKETEPNKTKYNMGNHLCAQCIYTNWKHMERIIKLETLQ